MPIIISPNIESSPSSEAVTSAGTWAKATGLKERNHFTKRVVLLAAMFSYDNYECTTANEKIILAAMKRERRTSRDIARDLGLFPPIAFEVTRDEQWHSHRRLRTDTSKHKRLALSQTFCAKIIHAMSTKTQKQDKRINVTLRRLRATTVAMEKQ
jgi:hypothetical protein